MAYPDPDSRAGRAHTGCSWLALPARAAGLLQCWLPVRVGRADLLKLQLG